MRFRVDPIENLPDQRRGLSSIYLDLGPEEPCHEGQQERRSDGQGRLHLGAKPSFGTIPQRGRVIAPQVESATQPPLRLPDDARHFLAAHLGQVIDLELAKVAVSDPIVADQTLPGHRARGRNLEPHECISRMASKKVHLYGGQGTGPERLLAR